MPAATANPSSVTYIPLDDLSDTGNALKIASTFGYIGKVETALDAQGEVVWAIELNGRGNADAAGRPLPVMARLGEVLVWDGMRLDSLSREIFDAKYTTV